MVKINEQDELPCLIVLESKDKTFVDVNTLLATFATAQILKVLYRKFIRIYYLFNFLIKNVRSFRFSFLQLLHDILQLIRKPVVKWHFCHFPKSSSSSLSLIFLYPYFVKCSSSILRNFFMYSSLASFSM